MYRPEKIISGGQTGADIGGLIGAEWVGIKTGGCAPRGYKTERGPQPEISKAYGLVEHLSARYSDRTRQNVIDADATLIVATDPTSDGTKLTIQTCRSEGKPYLVVNPGDATAIEMARRFIETEKPTILNIAGNRESKSPSIAAATARLVEQIFSATAENR